jgi:hypothetical protein
VQVLVVTVQAFWEVTVIGFVVPGEEPRVACYSKMNDAGKGQHHKSGSLSWRHKVISVNEQSAHVKYFQNPKILNP